MSFNEFIFETTRYEAYIRVYWLPHMIDGIQKTIADLYQPREKLGRKPTSSGEFIFGNMQQQVKDEPIQGPNLSTSSIDTVYGWYVAQLKKLNPEAKVSDITAKYASPLMCVIGCESTGKSATIENMTKVPMFPTDSGICTRCPIRVVMMPTDSIPVKKVLLKKGKQPAPASAYDGAGRYTLRYAGRPDEYFDDSNCHLIKDRVAAIFEEIRRASSHGYDNKEITITVERTNVIRMDFIDLPGIVSYPPESRDFTMNLSTKYINDPNSFILCVANATTPRLTSYEPIARIIQANACQRTILVLPMADKLPKRDIGTHLADRVLQVSDELSTHKFSACCAVVNRSDSSISLVDHTEAEADWFNKMVLKPVQQGIDACKDKAQRAEHQKVLQKLEASVGIESLVRVATDKYEEYIRINWLPRTIDEVNKTIAELYKQKEQLGKQATKTTLPQFQQVWSIIIEVLASSQAKLWSPDSIQAAVCNAQNIQWGLQQMTEDGVWASMIEEITHPHKWNFEYIRATCMNYGRVDIAAPPYCFQRFPCLLPALQECVVKYLEKYLRPHFSTLFSGYVFPALLGADGFARSGNGPIHCVMVRIAPGLKEAALKLLSMEKLSLELLQEDSESALQRLKLEKRIISHEQVMAEMTSMKVAPK